MLIAVNFTITAIGLWIKSGQKATKEPAVTSEEKLAGTKSGLEKETLLKISTIPATTDEYERHLVLPIAFILLTHFLGFIPLYVFNTFPTPTLSPIFYAFTIISLVLPFALSFILHTLFKPTMQDYTLIKCFSLLMLGLFLSALATLNFSLSFLIGLFSTPFTFAAPQRKSRWWLAVLMEVALHVLAPTTALVGVAVYWREDLSRILAEAAFGWAVWGMWTQVVVWCVWWPAWVVAGVNVAGTWWGMGKSAEIVKR